MRVGVPREIKVHEYRVGLTPTSVREVVAHGHEVLVERGAGAGIGAGDGAYEKAGAKIVDNAFAGAELIVKVKEPQPEERARLREHHVLFTYLHLAPDPQQARDLVAAGAICIAYETVTRSGGGLPLLAPMSEVAGRMAIQVGAGCLEKERGGMGTLLAGVPGVPAAKIAILGAGVVGSNAARMAVGSGARVFALVSRALLKRMKPGAALVDVSIDQGGCFETSRPTTHADPTYLVDGVVHYCVANMPGAVPRTSTYALNNATLPFVLALADKGWARALADDPHLMQGLNVARGKVTYRAVAQALGLDYTPAESLL
jgi:alanine dehydrogenase